MNYTLTNKRQWAALFLLGLGYATIYLDMTALNIALPFIQEAFNASSTQLFWIVNTYIVTTAGFALAGGRIGDLFGLRNTFILGVAIFGVTSVGCAVASTAFQLIFWRALQGIGAALTISNAAACIYQIFPKERQGKAMGFFGLTSVLFIVIGPAVGGFFTQFLTWRWVFGINPFLGAISCGFVHYLLRGLDRVRDYEAKFDYVGQFLLLGFMIPIITAFMQAQKWGWTSKSIVNLFTVGLLFFVSFIFYEKRQKHPLFDFSLFKNPNFKVSILLFFFSQFAVVSNVLFSLYLEKCMHMAPLKAGIALLPGALFGFFGNPVAGSFIDKYGVKRVIQLGLFSAMISFIWLAVTAFTLNYTYMCIALLCLSLALPLYMIGIFVMAMQTAQPNQKGMLAGISMTMRQTGGAFAVAFMTLIVSVCEQRYSERLSPSDTFLRGYAAAMLLIAVAMGIALYMSIWIGQEKPAEDSLEESQEPLLEDVTTD